MTDWVSKAGQVLEPLLRAERGRLLAALVARTDDFQRAEDALQDAAASALVHWDRTGVPDHPQAWLLRAALRKIIDQYRRDRTARLHVAETMALGQEEAALADLPEISDDRLRLIFTCCHPALEEKTRVALTLRSLCGLSTAEVAAIFLDTEPTMGQRLSRARAKIVSARIPFAVPGHEHWDARLGSVLTVVYLIFTRGYVIGPASPRDLCDEAIFLGRLLAHLRPGEPEIEGCLALLLLTHARAAARTGPQGETVPPSQQDRSLWSWDMIAEGQELLDRALKHRRPGPFQIKAAIAALHLAPGLTDWPQIALLYAALRHHEPGPVVALNHAVALAEADGPASALPLIEALAPQLQGYQPFHAARAECLARLGQYAKAREAYGCAVELAESAADRAFLTRRCARLP